MMNMAIPNSVLWVTGFLMSIDLRTVHHLPELQELKQVSLLDTFAVQAKTQLQKWKAVCLIKIKNK